VYMYLEQQRRLATEMPRIGLFRLGLSNASDVGRQRTPGLFPAKSLLALPLERAQTLAVAIRHQALVHLMEQPEGVKRLNALIPAMCKGRNIVEGLAGWQKESDGQ
jgi:hypothetical protein